MISIVAAASTSPELGCRLPLFIHNCTLHLHKEKKKRRLVSALPTQMLLFSRIKQFLCNKTHREKKTWIWPSARNFSLVRTNGPKLAEKAERLSGVAQRALDLVEADYTHAQQRVTFGKSTASHCQAIKFKTG